MRKRPWLRRAVVLLLLLATATAGSSRLLRARRIHHYLSARLEAAFGRPVEVSRFDFSLLAGPRLVAEPITVAEDPRFGYEYFLRAERLTASLRWRSLLRGRFDFGTLSFTRPSLNFVRAADGHWNVESWLPPAALPPAASNTSQNPHARLYHIEVDTGRINFKRGADKHPFALADVKGIVEQESAGRWRIDLQARPIRAAVMLQEAGTLRLRGRIAGTSARLQPADLELTWQEASLADALRLARGKDYGVRGRLTVQLAARSETPAATSLGAPPRSNSRQQSSVEPSGGRWSFVASALLENAHRWDLPRRPGDPALSLRAEAQWLPDEARLELSNCLIQAPRSSARATGTILWAPIFSPEFRFTSSGISFADVLSWYRAFRPAVAEGLALDGTAAIDLALRGWPPRLEQASLASDGVRVRAGNLPEPSIVSRIAVHLRPGQPTRVVLEPATITLAGAPRPGPGKTVPRIIRGQALRQSNALRLEGVLRLGQDSSLARPDDAAFELSLTGQTDRAQDLLGAAEAFGYKLNRGWSVEGSVDLRLGWSGRLYPFEASPRGTMDLRGLQLRTSYLNQVVSITSARIEFDQYVRRVSQIVAQAFGSRWTGSLWKSPRSADASAMNWSFELKVDRLDAVQLDRWLGPRARPSLL